MNDEGYYISRVVRVQVGALAAAVVLLIGFTGACAQEPMDCFCEEEGMAGLDVGFIVAGLVLTGSNIVITAYNSSRLNAGDPSGGGGMGGILVGTLGVIYGTAIIFSDEPAVSYAGVGCVAVGALSFYYGVRSTRASNRKYDEEHGMVIDPILIDDGTGRLGPGVQVSWSF